MSPRHGIAAASGCSSCWSAAGLRGGQEWRPGAFVTAIHASHIPALEAAGWQARNLYDDGTDDVLCEHLVAEVA